MRRKARTALGVDISGGEIRLALVKRLGRAVELVKSVSGPVPAGALSGGNVSGAAALGRAIRELVTRNKIKADEVAVGLYTRPVFMQIMDMPKSVPENLRQFVEKEVKHCIRTSSDVVCMDYCGIDARTRLGDKRIFAVAAENQFVVELAGAVTRAGLDVKHVEPIMLSYMRTMYDKRIARRKKSNVMFALVRDGRLTLCVMMNEKLDFVRSKAIDKMGDSQESLGGWLAEQINAVVTYYDVDVADSSKQWEVTVITDGLGFGEGFEQGLKEKAWGVEIEVIRGESALSEVSGSVSGVEKVKTSSAAAVGLALGTLGMDRSGVEVNLLPGEVVEHKKAKCDVLIAGNVAAAIMLVFILGVSAWALRIAHIKGSITAIKDIAPQSQAAELVKGHAKFDIQLGRISGKVKRLEQISKSHSDLNWQQVLKDIGNAASRDICITGLSTGREGKLGISGLALSNEGVYDFMDGLEKSEKIDIALLNETQKYGNRDDVLSYEIGCVLSGGKGGKSDVE